MEPVRFSETSYQTFPHDVQPKEKTVVYTKWLTDQLQITQSSIGSQRPAGQQFYCFYWGAVVDQSVRDVCMRTNSWYMFGVQLHNSSVGTTAASCAGWMSRNRSPRKIWVFASRSLWEPAGVLFGAERAVCSDRHCSLLNTSGTFTASQMPIVYVVCSFYLLNAWRIDKNLACMFRAACPTSNSDYIWMILPLPARIVIRQIMLVSGTHTCRMDRK